MLAALRARPAASLVVALLGAAATGAVVAATAFAAGSLEPPAPVATDAVRWTASAETAAALAGRAVAQLIGWLVVLAWTAAGVGTVTILAIGAGETAVRAPELAVHRAIGASRRALTTAALFEGLTLALAAVLVGLALGAAAAAAGWRAWPGAGAGPSLAPGAAVLAVAGAVIVAAAIPLWSIRSRRVVAAGDGVPPLGFASVQLGASLAILVAGALLVDHARVTVPPGGDPGAGTIYQLSATDPDLAVRAARYHALLARLGAAPGAVVSLASPGGHHGAGTVDHLTTDCGRCFVGGIFLKWRSLRAGYQTASPDTFDARGLRVVAGRTFSLDDRLGAPPVAVVNRFLAGRYFEGGNPLGRAVYLGGKIGGTPYTVVGVVDDGSPGGVGAGLAPRETIYLSTLQHPGDRVELLVRGSATRPAGPGVEVLAAEPAAVPGARVAAVVAWFGRAFVAAGAAVLVLALGGVAALIGLWAAALRPELGLRRAVGARRGQIVVLVLGRTARTAAVGLGIGLAFFAPALWPELAALAPGLAWWRPGLVAAVGVALGGAALGVAGGIAVRAGRVPPAEAVGTR